MTVPIPQTDILPIVGFGVEEYADWFERGFFALSSTDEAVVGRAFSPLHNVLAVSSSHIEGLESIYRALPAGTHATQHFRRGLAEAFGRLSRNSPLLLSQLDDILRLCQLIQADELAPLLLPFFSDIGVAANDYSILRQALTYLASLSGYDGATRVIRGLLTLPDSSPSYAIFGWLAMCRCDPGNWSHHLDSLRNRIYQALAEYSGTHNAITATRFAAFVPLSEVAGQLSSLLYFRNRALKKAADNWLMESLVGQCDSPYVILRERDSEVQRDGYLFLKPRNATDEDRWPIMESSAISVINTDTNWFLNHVAQDVFTTPVAEKIFVRNKVIKDVGTVERFLASFGSLGAPELGVQGVY